MITMGYQPNPYVGKTYNGKWTEGITVISGEFEVMEFLPYEPSAYVWSSCFTLIAPGTEIVDDKTTIWSVDEWDLIEQIDPEQYARMVKYEQIETERVTRMCLTIPRKHDTIAL